MDSSKDEPCACNPNQSVEARSDVSSQKYSFTSTFDRMESRNHNEIDVFLTHSITLTLSFSCRNLVNDMLLRLVILATTVSAFTPNSSLASFRLPIDCSATADRRTFLVGGVVATTLGVFATTPPAQAVGPVKVLLLNPTYTAVPCPSSKPIPGEKAMKGLRGLCVTVKADLAEAPAKVCTTYIIVSRDTCCQNAFVTAYSK